MPHAPCNVYALSQHLLQAAGLNLQDAILQDLLHNKDLLLDMTEAVRENITELFNAVAFLHEDVSTSCCYERHACTHCDR
jgi:hypothetical protein